MASNLFHVGCVGEKSHLQRMRLRMSHESWLVGCTRPRQTGTRARQRQRHLQHSTPPRRRTLRGTCTCPPPAKAGVKWAQNQTGRCTHTNSYVSIEQNVWLGSEPSWFTLGSGECECGRRGKGARGQETACRAQRLHELVSTHHTLSHTIVSSACMEEAAPLCLAWATDLSAAWPRASPRRLAERWWWLGRRRWRSSRA